jgi:predicted N-acyltransferase
MGALQARCLRSIREIPREQWEGLWPPQAEGYDFYLCQEEAGIADFEFFYLGLYAGDQPVLLAPLFTAPFNMGLAMNDAWRARLEKLQRRWAGLLVIKTLFCGSPTSEHNVVGVAEAYRDDPALFAALDRALLDLARRHRVFMVVFKDQHDADAARFSPLKQLGWFGGDSMDTAILDTPYSSMDEYFAQLGPRTRKELRRKLRQAAGELDVETVADISAVVDDVYRLYKGVHDRGIMSFEVLTPAFFLNFCRYMPDNTLFFLYWTKTDADGGRRLVGMDFCLHFEDRMLAKYTGMDYSVSRELNLYFIGLLSNIEWCIRNGKQRCMLGPGSYSVKQHLKARLAPLRTLTKIVNPLINWFPSRLA